MAFSKKMQVPTANSKRSNFPVNPQHITTSNFLELNVAYAMELVPEESIQVNHTLFSRLEPLPVPTFGKANIVNRVFWVPFRTVWRGWNDFITDVPHVDSFADDRLLTSVPVILNDDFVALFTSSDAATEVTETTTAFDFDYDGTQYNLTAFGRWCLKTLHALGYKFSMSAGITQPVSALPLLCFFRVFVDWYYPSQYANNEDMRFILMLLETDKPSVDSSHFIGDSLLRCMRAVYNVQYDADYFTSAWDNPMSPNDGLSSSFTFFQPGGDPQDIQDVVSNTSEPGADPQDAALYPTRGFTQYMLNALRGLTDYMKRHQIAGARVLDRYLSRFGVRLPDEKLNRSSLISTYAQSIKFGDVTSTASTEDAPLGSYAGKGLSYGDGNFTIDSNGEYGFMIITTNIIPVIGYYQGLNRHTLHLSKLDFHTGEFDGLGTQAISAAELYMPFKSRFSGPETNRLYDKVFGFTSKYGEYRVAQSLLTGDYILDSRNVGEQSWTLFRDVSSYADNVDNLEHDYDFVVATDKAQFNRIFWDVTDRADKFRIVHDLNINVSFPGASFFDTYEFKDEDKARKQSIDVGGTTLT